MFLLLASAIMGSVAASVFCWQYGILAMLVAAPLGGTCLMLITSGYLAWQDGPTPVHSFEPDELVSQLRDLTDQAQHCDVPMGTGEGPKVPVRAA